jgi:hypothetical protein
VTDLERFQAGRDDALIRKFSHRIEPTWGFIAYGVLWLCVSGLPAVVLPLGAALVMKSLGFSNDGVVATVAIWILLVVGWAIGWWPFVWWARRKRRRAREVIRDGALCTAVVATSTTDRLAQIAARLAMAAAGQSMSGAHWERVEFEHEGIRYAGVAPFDSRPSNGTPSHVLFKPGAKYALAFSPSGHAFVTKVHPR